MKTTFTVRYTGRKAAAIRPTDVCAVTFDADSAEAARQRVADNGFTVVGMTEADHSTRLLALHAPGGVFPRGALCIVEHDRDGRTLWDCECAECRQMQREANR